MPDDEGLDHPLFRANVLWEPGGGSGYHHLSDTHFLIDPNLEVERHEIAHRAWVSYLGQLGVATAFDLSRLLAAVSSGLLHIALFYAVRNRMQIEGTQLANLRPLGGNEVNRFVMERILEKVRSVEAFHDELWLATEFVAELAAIDVTDWPNGGEGVPHPREWSEERKRKELDAYARRVSQQVPHLDAAYRDVGGYREAVRLAWHRYNTVISTGARTQLLVLALKLAFVNERGEPQIRDPIRLISELADLAHREGSRAEELFTSMVESRSGDEDAVGALMMEVAFGEGEGDRELFLAYLGWLSNDDEPISEELMREAFWETSPEAGMVDIVKPVVQRGGTLANMVWMQQVWEAEIEEPGLRVRRHLRNTHDPGDFPEELREAIWGEWDTNAAHGRPLLSFYRFSDREHQRHNAALAPFQVSQKSIGVNEWLLYAVRKRPDLSRLTSFDPMWWRMLVADQMIRQAVKTGAPLVCPFRGWVWRSNTGYCPADCPIRAFISLAAVWRGLALPIEQAVCDSVPGPMSVFLSGGLVASATPRDIGEIIEWIDGGRPD